MGRSQVNWTLWRDLNSASPYPSVAVDCSTLSPCTMCHIIVPKFTVGVHLRTIWQLWYSNFACLSPSPFVEGSYRFTLHAVTFLSCCDASLSVPLFSLVAWPCGYYGFLVKRIIFRSFILPLGFCFALFLYGLLLFCLGGDSSKLSAAIT